MHFTVHLKSPVWTHLKVKVHRIPFTTCLQDYELFVACFCHGRSGYREVDDDIYLHIPKMIWWLKMSSLPEKLYDGKVQDGVEFKVIRDPKHKWFVSEQFLNDSWFPPYCNGPFYISSKSAFLGLLKVSSNEGPTHFPLEDANIGILARRVGTGTILKF